MAQTLAVACSFADDFWGISAANIGPEVLGRVNETVRISPEQRATLGTHSTPTFLVDYVVGGLAEHILNLDHARRVIAEPACGHGGFLVAAVRLLASDVPTGSDRQAYLRCRVRGHDVDGVSAEVARLSLTLADIPNPDGWQIDGGTDMFVGEQLEILVRGAGVVLANPPFENFSAGERAELAAAGVKPLHASRAVETFHRCLEAVEPGTLLGFVLPPSLLDAPARSAVNLRRRILERADILEVTELPDGVFREAETGSFTILARVRSAGDIPAVEWDFCRVTERGLAEFRETGEPSARVRVRRINVLQDGNVSLRVPPHFETWDLRAWSRLRESVASLGQGGVTKCIGASRCAVRIDRSAPRTGGGCSFSTSYWYPAPRGDCPTDGREAGTTARGSVLSAARCAQSVAAVARGLVVAGVYRPRGIPRAPGRLRR